MTSSAKTSPKKRGSLRALTDLLVLLAGQMSARIIGFIAFAYLARVLSTDDYGAVETVVGMAAMGLACIEFGIGTMGARRIAQGEAQVGAVVRAVVSARILLVALVIPLIALLYIYLTKDRIPLILILAFAFSLIGGIAKQDWLFQALERMNIAAFGATLKMLVFFAAIFLLMPGKNGVIMVGVAEIAAMTAMAIYFIIAQAMTIGLGRPRLSVRPGIELVASSSPLGLSALANSLAAAAPILIVAAVVGTDDAGKLGASLRITVSLLTFSWLYYFNLFPLIAKSLHNDLQFLKRLMAASETFLAWGGITGALLVTILAEPIMATVFGQDFAYAGPYLAILIWAVPASFASGTSRWLLTAQDKQSRVLLIQVIGVSSGIILALSLIHTIGPIAGAIGYTASAFINWVVAHVIASRGKVVPRITPFLLPAFLAASILFGASYVDLPIAYTIALAATIMTIGALMGSKFVESCLLLAHSKSGVPLSEAT